MPDDYLSTTQTTGAVAVGGSATGDIETSKDFDWFAVDLVAGHTYVIDLEGADSGGGALQDPVLRGLYDADGNRIAGARDNDGGAGRDARLTFTAATTGAYYIEARGHSNQTGEYTVRVTEWVDTDAERGGADRSRRYHGSPGCSFRQHHSTAPPTRWTTGASRFRRPGGLDWVCASRM